MPTTETLRTVWTVVQIHRWPEGQIRSEAVMAVSYDQPTARAEQLAMSRTNRDRHVTYELRADPEHVR